MSMWRLILFAVIVTSGLVLALAGCGGAPFGWDTVEKHDFDVARADNGYVLPASHLYEIVYFNRVAPEGGLVSDSAIEAVRDSVIVDTLVRMTAEKYNLRSDYYYWREYLDQYYDYLRKVFWDTTVVAKIELDSTDIRDYYESHIAAYSRREQVLVYHLLASPIGFSQNADSVVVRGFSAEQLHEAAELYAWRMHRLLDYGEAFENVAYLYSHDQTTRDKGGRLGWTGRGFYVDPFDSVAFSLEPGTYSEPYEDADGFHILYVQTHTEAGPIPLDSPRVMVQVQQDLYREKSTAMASAILDSLRKIAQIEVNQAILDTNIYYVQDSTWAAVINGTDTLPASELKNLEEDYRRGLQVAETNHDMRLQMITQASGPYLVVEAARSLGLDTLPDVVQVERHFRFTTAQKILITELYAPEYDPPDSAFEPYYMAHLDEYQPTHHLEVEQLKTHDPNLAQFLREQTGTGMSMSEMADYYRGEGYQVDYSYLGVLDKATTDTAIYSAVEATAAGRMTRVVEKDGDYYVFKVLSRKHFTPLSMARAEIRSRLIAEYRYHYWLKKRDEYFRDYHVVLLRDLPEFELPRMADRTHPRTLPRSR